MTTYTLESWIRRGVWGRARGPIPTLTEAREYAALVPGRYRIVSDQTGNVIETFDVPGTEPAK